FFGFPVPALALAPYFAVDFDLVLVFRVRFQVMDQAMIHLVGDFGPHHVAGGVGDGHDRRTVGFRLGANRLLSRWVYVLQVLITHQLELIFVLLDPKIEGTPGDERRLMCETCEVQVGFGMEFRHPSPLERICVFSRSVHHMTTANLATKRTLSSGQRPSGASGARRLRNGWRGGPPCSARRCLRGAPACETAPYSPRA